MVSAAEPNEPKDFTKHTDDGEPEEDAYSSSGAETCSTSSYNGALALQHQHHDDDLYGDDDDGEDNSLATTIGAPVASFGNVAVTNSTDVHFGNKTYYQGPVTIKQILYAKGNGEVGGGDLAAIAGATNGDVIVRNGGLVSGGEKDNVSYETDGGLRDSFPGKGGVGEDGRTVGQRVVTAKGFNWLPTLSHTHFLIVGTLVILMVSLVTLAAVLLTKTAPGPIRNRPYPVDSTEQDHGTPIDGPIDPNVNTTLSGKLKIISRAEWVGQPPVEAANVLNTPVPYVIIMHTATDNCSDQAKCVFHVRFIQTFHIESRGWWDIGYNFLVGGDGFVYEGRGWQSEGAHTYGYNTKSIGIAFIGTFMKMVPPDQQILAAKQLIQRGVELGYLQKDYKVLAARQLQTTQSPGEAFYNDIKTWPHWSPTP